MYEPRYNEQSLDGQTTLSYDTATRIFTVNSSDPSLSGTVVPYSVIATFADYPLNDYSKAPVVENGANILFDEPCESPTVFKASAQSDLAKSDAFSSTPVTF